MFINGLLPDFIIKGVKMCYKRYERLVKLIGNGEVHFYEEAKRLAKSEGIGPEGIEAAKNKGLTLITEKHFFMRRKGLPDYLNQEPKSRTSYFFH